VQDKQITNPSEVSELLSVPQAGRIIALDIGTKKIGVAVCDEMQIAVRALPVIPRKSWKELLKTVVSLIEEYDAIALVLGLPYNFDGAENEMTTDVRRLHRNFSLSLKIPVFMQDERLTTRTASDRLHEQGYNFKEILKRLDSEAAKIILSEFIELKEALRRDVKGNDD
jgi:putative holliday junction resolvase